jgi:hypothetical protein
MSHDHGGPLGYSVNKKVLPRFFGTNRGTHWTVAGSVAVIVLGSYLLYNNHDRNPAAATAVPAAEQAQVPLAPAPLN